MITGGPPTPRADATRNFRDAKSVPVPAFNHDIAWRQRDLWR